MGISGNWAILPVKPFHLAKSRLAGVLAPTERESLAIHLFRGSLDFLVSTDLFMGIVVVSRDPRALAMARAYTTGNVHALAETGAPELNAALTEAAEYAKRCGADCVFVLPTDVPFITRADVQMMNRASGYRSGIVIAPDRGRTGTNALLLAPPDVIPFAFGENSYVAHSRLAMQADVICHVYESERVALDIDTPPDLDTYRALMAARQSTQGVL